MTNKTLEQLLIEQGWFKYEDYKKCKSFTPTDWLNHLELRNIIFEIMEESEDKNFKEDFDISSIYLAHRKEIISDFDYTHKARTRYLNRIGYNEKNYKYCIESGFIKKGVSQVVWNDLGLSEDKNIKSLTIDLNENNKTLKDNFNTWLNEKRKKEKLTHHAPLTKRTLDNWAKWGVLGLYDLLLWCKYENYTYGKNGKYRLIDLFAFLHKELHKIDKAENFEPYGKKAMREITKIRSKGLLDKLYKEILFNKI